MNALLAITLVLLDCLIIKYLLPQKATKKIEEVAKDVKNSIDDFIAKPDEELERMQNILNNIDKYDGTPKGQVKI